MTVFYHENNELDIVSFSYWRANNIIQSVIDACIQFNCTIDYSTIRIVDLDNNKYTDIKDCNYEVYIIDPKTDKEIRLFNIKGLQTYFSLDQLAKNLFLDIGLIANHRTIKNINIKVDCQGFLLTTFFKSFFPSPNKDFIEIMIETDIKSNTSSVGCFRFKKSYTNGRYFNIKKYEIPISDFMLVFNLEQLSQSNHELAQLIPEVSILSAYDFNSIDFNNRLSIAQIMIS